MYLSNRRLQRLGNQFESGAMKITTTRIFGNTSQQFLDMVAKEHGMQ